VRVKAFLLAAGLGTRLRPLTATMPKCMISVGGRPMLDIWLDTLAKTGVDEVLVNIHHFAPMVHEHLAARLAPPAVRVVHEPVLLGSAGTLVANRDFVRGAEMFLALYADNLTDFDLRILVDAHRAGGASATLSVFRAPRPSECGILEVHDGEVVGFVEKPAEPRSDLANAGMYAFHPDVLDLVDPASPADIGFHLLPRLVGRARAVAIGDSFLVDIGTPQALERARREWESRYPS
jgi:mannose-1-phosphate guanylyltransferase